MHVDEYMTIKEILNWASNKLKFLNSPQLDAEVLLSFVLKKDKIYLYTYPEKSLTITQIKKYISLINKRRNYVPVAYLTHHKEFYNLNFYINKNVLVPRPATEILVDQSISLINKYNLKTLADIGTGSGCIAISIKKNLPQIKVYANDINKKALWVAKKNAQLNKTKIIFKHGDLLTPYKHLPIDIFVANLPYLSHKIYQKEKSIKHEPKQALFAKNQGLKYIEDVILQIENLDYKPKFLLIEFDPWQKKIIINKTKKYNYKTKIIKDFDQLDRTLTIEL